jgi:hypothetical protein
MIACLDPPETRKSLYDESADVDGVVDGVGDGDENRRLSLGVCRRRRT